MSFTEESRADGQYMGRGLLSTTYVKSLRSEVGRMALAALAVVIVAAPRAAQPPEPLWDTGTFSILGFDPATGEVGGAVQSRGMAPAAIIKQILDEDKD